MMSEDQLLQIHTSHYEESFLLCVEVHVDSEVLQIEGNAKSLMLHCSHLNIHFAPLDFREAITSPCLSHGAQFIGRMKCSKYPLFEIDFVNAHAVHSFLTSTNKGDLPASIQINLLKCVDVDKLRPKQTDLPQLDVALKLLMLTPNASSRDPSLRLVTLTNYQDCIKVFRAGRSFDYGSLLRLFQENRCKEVPDLAVLMNELREVVSWVTLGLNLGIPYHELRRIQSIYGMKIEGLLEMLDIWLKSGNASWSRLIEALQKSGFYALAKRLAVSHDISLMLESPVHSAKNRKIEFDLNEDIKPSFDMEERDREIYKVEVSLSKIQKREQKLSTSLYDIKEHIKEVTDKLNQLTSKHQKLNSTLEKKKQYRMYLLNQPEDQSNDVLKDMIEEIEEAISQAQEQICAVEDEMKKCRGKEEQLRYELMLKEDELSRLRYNMETMKWKNVQLQNEIDVQRRLYEMEIRAMLAREESEQKLQEELKQQVAFLREELVHKRKEIGDLQQKVYNPTTIEELKAQVNYLSQLLAQSSSDLPPAIPPKPKFSPQAVVPPVPMKRATSSPQLERPLSSPVMQRKDSNTSRLIKTRSTQEYNDRNMAILNILDTSGIPWYYKQMDEVDAEKLLTSCSSFTAGTFLVRGVNTQSKYLSILGSNQVYHFCIYTDNNNKYYLTKECKFISIEELILHYKKTNDFLPYPLGAPCSMLGLISRKDIKVCSLYVQSSQLYEGNYSQLYRAVMNDYHPVIAKAKKLNTSISDYHFLTEAVVMRSLQHNNIHQYVGITTIGSDQHLCILMESAINISLKDHLEKNKTTLTWHNLMSITKQIARGMCYLEQQRCILRSLAGKYIVVTGASAVKISNFSIACFSPSGTFSCQSKFTILVRWAAPELMFDGLCSTKSDVWSFGVTFWEILTYGAKPYEGFGSGSVKEMVKSGYRMPLSELHLPQQIHSIMTDCWRKLPQDRPSFKNLLDRLIVIQDGINTPVQI